MKNLKLNHLKNQIVENLLNINSNDCALGVSDNFDMQTLNVDVVLNAIDNELIVISTIIKTFTDVVLMQGWKFENFNYKICVNYLDDCAEINFQLFVTN